MFRRCASYLVQIHYRHFFRSSQVSSWGFRPVMPPQTGWNQSAPFTNLAGLPFPHGQIVKLNSTFTKILLHTYISHGHNTGPFGSKLLDPAGLSFPALPDHIYPAGFVFPALSDFTEVSRRARLSPHCRTYYQQRTSLDWSTAAKQLTEGGSKAPLPDTIITHKAIRA